MVNIICPLCGAPMILRITSKFQYADGTNRKFYGCSKFPECRSAHGANPDGSPVGIPADDETKKLRIKAHDLFDRLWKSRYVSRGKAYAIMQEKLHISAEECHIGMMDKTMAQKVIDIFSDFEFNSANCK